MPNFRSDSPANHFRAFRKFVKPLAQRIWLSPLSKSALTWTPQPSLVDKNIDILPHTGAVLDLLDGSEQIVANRFKSLLQRGDPVTSSFASRAEAHAFLRTLPSRSRLAVESPYGKDSSVNRCFMTEKTMKHTYLLLFKSGFLDLASHIALFKGRTGALLLWLLWREQEVVDFRQLQNPLPTLQSPDVLIHR